MITPSSDPVSMLALAVPLYLFYEFAIVFGWLYNRRKRKRAARAPRPPTAQARDPGRGRRAGATVPGRRPSP